MPPLSLRMNSERPKKPNSCSSAPKAHRSPCGMIKLDSSRPGTRTAAGLVRIVAGLKVRFFSLATSFDVVHDIPQLIEKRGGNVAFVKSLEEHFNGGHNDHTNEPSHHIPYLYALSGAAWKTQERVREIARANYDNTPTGLSGVRSNVPILMNTHLNRHRTKIADR